MFSLDINRYLKLKLRDTSHAQETFDLIDSNRAHLSEWLSWVGKVKQVQHSIDNVLLNIESWELKTDLNLGIYYQKKMVGMISLHDINYINHHASIGYWLARGAEGKGIMNRSVKRVLQYGFDELKLHRIEIRAAVHNLRSRAIPERLGFTQEGIARGWERVNGKYLDMAVYAILRKEFD